MSSRPSRNPFGKQPLQVDTPRSPDPMSDPLSLAQVGLHAVGIGAAVLTGLGALMSVAGIVMTWPVAGPRLPQLFSLSNSTLLLWIVAGGVFSWRALTRRHTRLRAYSFLWAATGLGHSVVSARVGTHWIQSIALPSFMLLAAGALSLAAERLEAAV